MWGTQLTKTTAATKAFLPFFTLHTQKWLFEIPNEPLRLLYIIPLYSFSNYFSIKSKPACPFAFLTCNLFHFLFENQ